MEGADDKVRGMRTERKGKIEGEERRGGERNRKRRRVEVGEERRGTRGGKGPAKREVQRRGEGPVENRSGMVWKQGGGRRERKGSGMR